MFKCLLEKFNLKNHLSIQCRHNYTKITDRLLIELHIGKTDDNIEVPKTRKAL